MAEQLGDLLIFVSIVAVLVVVSVLVGMLVAGRVDRLMAPRPKAGAAPDAHPPAPTGEPTPVAEAMGTVMTEDEQA